MIALDENFALLGANTGLERLQSTSKFNNVFRLIIYELFYIS